jgi:glucokinase
MTAGSSLRWHDLLDIKGENEMILAADIGGTKTALGIYSHDQGPRSPLAEGRFSSQDYASLEDIVSEFLSDKEVPLTRASIAVAGPVVGSRAEITNLSWVVEADPLSQALGDVPVNLLNDLAAIAHGVPHLQAEDLDIINQGDPVPHGAKAVIAPGTGLGEGFLIWNGTRYQACPSEGGHADFAPNDPLQDELLLYLRRRYSHVSCERACSGMGVPSLYAFFKESGRLSEPEWLQQQLSEARDQTPVIARSAAEEGVEISKATMNLFVSILGSEASNMALKVLATGGVYLAGGIPPRILPYLKGGLFMQAFTHKGRFSDFLAKVPVYVILYPKVGLMGAACHGLEI